MVTDFYIGKRFTRYNKVIIITERVAALLGMMADSSCANTHAYLPSSFNSLLLHERNQREIDGIR